MTEIKSQKLYYVVYCALKYRSIDDAKTQAPAEIAEHINRSKELHQQGKLLMAGAFLDQSQDHFNTMAVLISKEAAEEYLKGDPFYANGMMSDWAIREWANMFA